jgi:hypothetical protein
LATAALAGCSGAAHHAAATPVAPNASAKAAIAAAQDIANNPADRKAVSVSACTSSSSGWTATGKVTNPASKSATYAIVISFTDKQSTVLTRGTTKVTVKAGATKSWKASANFAKTKGVVCVLRGVSAS